MNNHYFMALLLLLYPLSNICSDSPQPSTALSKLTCCLKSAFSCGYVTFKTVEETCIIAGLACFCCCKVCCDNVCNKKVDKRDPLMGIARGR